MAPTSVPMPARKGHGRDRDTWGSAAHHLPTYLLLPITGGFRDIFHLCVRQGLKAARVGCCSLPCEGDLGVQQLCLALCDPPREGGCV